MREIAEYQLPDGSYVRKEFVYAAGSIDHPAYVEGKGVLVAVMNAAIDISTATAVAVGTIDGIAEQKQQSFLAQKEGFEQQARDYAVQMAENREALAQWMIDKGAPPKSIEIIFGVKPEERKGEYAKQDLV